MFKHRWATEINNLNFALHEVKRLAKKLIRKKRGRSRPPKHNPTAYAEVFGQECLTYSALCN